MQFHAFYCVVSHHGLKKADNNSKAYIYTKNIVPYVYCFNLEAIIQHKLYINKIILK